MNTNAVGMKTRITALTFGALLAGVSSCDDTSGRPDQAWGGAAADGKADDGQAEGGDAAPSAQPGLEAAFEAAADEFDVPVEVLEAIAWVESRWTMIDTDSDAAHGHGGPARHGVMGLSEGILDDAAALAGTEVDEAVADATENVRAAAAWLSAHADEIGIEDRTNLSSWAGTVGDYPGLPSSLARAGYVYDEVYKTLRTGFVAETVEGEYLGELAPIDVWPAFDVPPPSPALQPGHDYAPAVWRGSPNNSGRPSGSSGKPTLVIIHTCEGSYNGCWSWLTQSQSGVSAHYVVNDDGSQISQLVRESRKAWHISASYKCSRNGGKYCNLDNVSSNNFTIGIEHAGSASQAHWDEGLLEASAKLVCDITRDHGLSRD